MNQPRSDAACSSVPLECNVRTAGWYFVRFENWDGGHDDWCPAWWNGMFWGSYGYGGIPDSRAIVGDKIAMPNAALRGGEAVPLESTVRGLVVTTEKENVEMRREHSIQCARDKAVLRDKVLVLEEESERLRFELSVVWNTALDAAKKTTARGLIGASDKEKTAHYTACKNIADAIDALKVGTGGTAVQCELLPANAEITGRAA